MTIISKELFDQAGTFRCKNIHVWHNDCIKALLIYKNEIITAGLKFFLPVYLLQAAMYIRKDNAKSMTKHLMLSYLRSCTFGFLITIMTLGTNCVLSNIFGSLSYYCTFIAGMVGGAAIIIESPFYRSLNSLIFFNLVVESILNQLSYHKLIKFTTFNETLLFMNISAAVIYLHKYRKDTSKFTNFWFYSPGPKITDKLINERPDKTKICLHEGDCQTFSINGFKRYFLIGVLVNLIKTTLPKFLLLIKFPKLLAKKIFHQHNIKFGAFFGSYVAIYRYLTCYLLNKNNKERKRDIIFSAFTAGITYAIMPNVQILSIGITTILQLLFIQLRAELNILHKVPVWLVYILCSGILLYSGVVSPKTTPKYYMNVTNIFSNGRFKAMSEGLLKHVM